jgi:tetratricopeptide (TPR) repeat protein|tara:strand:+ start:343 stop:855 length:513 start_codon:yes stop_codon:yes gene_type:complete
MKFLISIIFYLLFIINSSFSFEQNPEPGDIGTGGREDSTFMNTKNSNIKKGKDALKQALKLTKKNKPKKANKKFEKAIKYFVLAYENSPEDTELLNQLGFTYNLVGDYLMSEIYYQEALTIDPKNPIINQRLGELYINTKRINLAKERLKSLSICNCQEYLNLKNIIEKN